MIRPGKESLLVFCCESKHILPVVLDLTSDANAETHLQAGPLLAGLGQGCFGQIFKDVIWRHVETIASRCTAFQMIRTISASVYWHVFMGGLKLIWANAPQITEVKLS